MICGIHLRNRVHQSNLRVYEVCGDQFLRLNQRATPPVLSHHKLVRCLRSELDHTKACSHSNLADRLSTLHRLLVAVVLRKIGSKQSCGVAPGQAVLEAVRVRTRRPHQVACMDARDEISERQ